MMSNSNYRLTTSKARSHCVRRHLHAHQETVDALVLGTRRKWPRPRRDRETRRWYVFRPSRDRDVETETTTLTTSRLQSTEPTVSCHAGQHWYNRSQSL